MISKKNTFVGGRIVSVKFEKAGLKTDQLIPWNLVEASGHPRKTSPFKIMADSVQMIGG